MEYISVYDHNTRKRLCFLENAYRVGYSKKVNALWTAQFTLPLGDRKNEYCLPLNYVELYDNGEYVGLFRIVPSTMAKSMNTKEITYQCEHVLATLLDDVLVGWHEIGNLGVYTNQVIQYVLEHQTVKNWVLNECDFKHQYLYGWEHENLLTALLSVPNPFVETYRWEFDTKSWPWSLSLKDVTGASESNVDFSWQSVSSQLVGVDISFPVSHMFVLNGKADGSSQNTIALSNPSADRMEDGWYTIQFKTSGSVSTTNSLYPTVNVGDSFGLKLSVVYDEFSFYWDSSVFGNYLNMSLQIPTWTGAYDNFSVSVSMTKVQQLRYNSSTNMSAPGVEVFDTRGTYTTWRDSDGFTHVSGTAGMFGMSVRGTFAVSDDELAVASCGSYSAVTKNLKNADILDGSYFAADAGAGAIFKVDVLATSKPIIVSSESHVFYESPRFFFEAGTVLNDFAVKFEKLQIYNLEKRIYSNPVTNEIRYQKNMLGIEKVTDATNICTRLYAFGYGEGSNQLNLAKINPTGQLYLDSDTQYKYGVISKIWIDRRYQLEDSLYAAAVQMLEKLKEPKVSYKVSAAHIGILRNVEVGDMVRVIDDEEEISAYLPVISITKGNITGDTTQAEIVLGGNDDNFASSLADINDRQRIQEAYSQGAVTLYSQSFRDNASKDSPAEMRFYLPENVVHINQIILYGKFSSFRGYSKAIKGGGGTSSTTSDGGGTTQTTSSGGSTNVTSEAGGSTSVTSESGGGATITSAGGGGSTVTSASGGGGSVTSAAGGSSSPTSASGGGTTVTSTYTSNEQIQTGQSSVGNYTVQTGTSENTSGTPIYNRYSSHSHSYVRPAIGYSNDGSYGMGWHSHLHWKMSSHAHNVSIGGHTHSVSIGSHTHSVSIGSHSHSVTIGNHTHSVTISSHTHTVKIGTHTHTVKIGSHTHSVTIPKHSHNFTVPDHSHDIEYGIYTGYVADNADIAVDDTSVGTFSEINSIDLIPYLKMDDEGKVVRGWHTIKVSPNKLSRVELDLAIQLFANSRGGGQY